MNDYDLPYGSIATNVDGNYYTVTNTGTSVPICNTSSQPASTIQGKMISVIEQIDFTFWEARDPKEIKMAMVSKIAEELIASKMVEFTSENDPMNLKVKIRARLFVTPDDQVRLLRKAGY